MKSCIAVMVLASLMGYATATPYPECESCHDCSDNDLDALYEAKKYLCCDLTCAENPTSGCGIFGLDPVCKACYEGDDLPSYDDEPVEGSDDDSTTSSTKSGDEPTSAPVNDVATPMPTALATTLGPVQRIGTPGPVPATAPTATSGFTQMPTSSPVETVSVTPSPVISTATGAPFATAATRAPVSEGVFTSAPTMTRTTRMPVTETILTASPTAMMPTYTLAPVDGDSDCDACDEAEAMLTQEDLDALASAGKELVCDSACLTEELDGCGAFGLDMECRSVSTEDYIETESPATTTSDAQSGSGSGSESGSSYGSGSGSSYGSGSSSGSGLVTLSPTPTPGGSGGGSDSTSGSSSSGGTASPTTPTGTGSSTSSSYDCSVCSDISPAQQEALDYYDNGGKQIVCDPTCLTGSDVSHCNYFGLGQICRGCGDCTDCTPCP